MRIAILSHACARFGHQYARAFAACGHEAEVWSLSGRTQSDPQPVRLVGPPGFDPLESDARLVPYLRCVSGVRRAVRKLKPDILFALYLTSAGVVAGLSGHPRVVVSAQGSDVNDHAGSRTWRAVLAWLGRRACLVHAVSDQLACTLRDRIGMPADKLLVAPIGVDTRLLPLVDPGSRPGRGEIVCTRAHAKVYDHATLLRAMVRLKQAGVRGRLLFTNKLMVGSTKSLVHELGLEDVVAFRDGYELAELPEILTGADVYVSSSLADGTSQSLLEAMATGTFPVVTDIPANRPWVEHGRNGFLFPAGDDVALAACLAEALSRPDLRAAAGPIGRALVVERGELCANSGVLLEAFQRCLQEAVCSR
ncbi:MAG: glycosyltransferase family 4 protein [Deltaproteobacteria bacterium]|nr:glycosyltransferase family 4 protein [Deltaproteobacteria bacterium]